MRIGVDLMGSDSSPQHLFEAVLEAVQNSQSFSRTFVVIATSSSIQDIQKRYQTVLLSLSKKQIEFHRVKDAIAMAEEPLKAIAKKGSSLVVGVHLLKKHNLDAFISAGNTGALIASATLNLPKLPGIRRPALMVVLPTITGPLVVIDVGGNVSCKSDHLVQFAYMGAAYQRCQGTLNPAVGLLNIGVEPKKGTSAVRQAYDILQENPAFNRLNMRFIGNVESRDLFKGGVDVLVTDGFTGNVLLKTAEGVVEFFLDELQQEMHSSLLKRGEALYEFKQKYNYKKYPGALLIGVEGIILKCHGSSCAKAFLASINEAISLVELNLISSLKNSLSLK